jgi:hypothetical protein
MITVNTLFSAAKLLPYIGISFGLLHPPNVYDLNRR